MWDQGTTRRPAANQRGQPDGSQHHSVGTRRASILLQSNGSIPLPALGTWSDASEKGITSVAAVVSDLYF